MMKNIKVALLSFTFSGGVSSDEIEGEDGTLLDYALNAPHGASRGGEYFLVQPDGKLPSCLNLTPCAEISQCIVADSRKELFKLMDVAPAVRMRHVRGVVANWSVAPGEAHRYLVGKEGDLSLQAEVTIKNVGDELIEPSVLVEISATEEPNVFEAQVVEGKGEYLLHEELIPDYLKAKLTYVPVAPIAGNIRLAAASA